MLDNLLLFSQQHATYLTPECRLCAVIHAGIYYPTGSLKARLCVQGKTDLYSYAEDRKISHRRFGKLIVATSDAQVPKLLELARTGAANGVGDLQILTRDECYRLEPALHAVAGLLSPSTGVIDSHGYMESLEADIIEVRASQTRG